MIKNIILVFFFFLCSSALLFSGGTQESTEVEEEQTETASEEWSWWASAAKPYEGDTISVRISYHPAIEAQIPWAIEDFEEMTGIKVDFSTMTRRDLIGKQEIELSANSDAYDVIYISMDVASRYKRAGWAEPLEPYINNKKLTSPDFDLNDFVQAYLDGVSPPMGEGDLLGLPFSGESNILYYRKDILDEHGIDQIPDTMEGLKELFQKIHSDEIPAFAARAQRGQGFNVFIWSGFLWNYGGKFFDDDMKPVINSPESVRATKEFANLLNKYGPDGIANMNHHDIVPLFAQGKLASFIDATVWVTVFQDPERSDIIGKWAATQVPKGPAGRFTPIGPQEIGINAFSKNKEAAWLFIQWFTGKEVQLKRATEVANRAGDITRRSVMENPDYREIWNEGTNWVDAAAEAATYARLDYRPTHLPEWTQIGDLIGIAVQDVITGQDAQTALDSANKKIMQLMERAGYYD